MAHYLKTFEYAVGDTDVTDTYVLKRNGVVIDLTGYTAVKLYARRKNDNVAVAVINGTIVTPASGLVSFDHTTIAATRGTYYCQVETTNASSKVRRSPVYQIDVIAKVET